MDEGGRCGQGAGVMMTGKNERSRTRRFGTPGPATPQPLDRGMSPCFITKPVSSCRLPPPPPRQPASVLLATLMAIRGSSSNRLARSTSEACGLGPGRVHLSFTKPLKLE